MLLWAFLRSSLEKCVHIMLSAQMMRRLMKNMWLRDVSMAYLGKLEAVLAILLRQGRVLRPNDMLMLRLMKSPCSGDTIRPLWKVEVVHVIYLQMRRLMMECLFSRDSLVPNLCMDSAHDVEYANMKADGNYVSRRICLGTTLLHCTQFITKTTSVYTIA